MLTPKDALAFVEEHGIVLESARGPVPSLASAIAGEEIRGSWWGHAKSEQIWVSTRRLRESEDILVCRLVGGKVTYVHRRLWPALVRLSDRFSADRIAQIRELHTEQGHHSVSETPFPAWVPTRRECSQEIGLPFVRSACEVYSQGFFELYPSRRKPR